MKAPLPDAPLYFVHIPKAAGSSVRANLAANFPRLIDLESVDRKTFSVPGQGPGVAVAGHNRYGAAGAEGETCNVITLVRDPAERLASLHRYLQTARRNPLHAQAVACPRFADFYALMVERGMVGSRQCGMVAGARRNATFDAARARIEADYILAAPTEYTGLFLLGCAHLLHWQRLDLRPANVSRTERQDMPDRLLLDIYDRCRDDYLLHAWLRTAFLERCRALEPGLEQTRTRLALPGLEVHSVPARPGQSWRRWLRLA